MGHTYVCPNCFMLEISELLRWLTYKEKNSRKKISIKIGHLTKELIFHKS